MLDDRAAITTARLPLLVAFLVLGAALGIAVLTTTPWQPLDVPPADHVAAAPARDFTAAEMAQAEAYQSAIRPPAYLSLGLSLALTLLLGLTPLGARIVTAAARPLGGGWAWQVLLGGLALLLIVRVATLPFSAWAETVRSTYGLSTRSWGGWAADVAKGFGINTALTLIVLLGLVALVRTMPRYWWAPAALGGAVLVVVVSFAYPLLVEPVFNKFTPMPQGQLRSDLLALAQHDGVPVEDVLVADASRRTTTLNAYVSGFGATRRIVVYDTLLEAAPPAEVETIVAHELGHAKENDVLKGTLLGALGLAAGVTILGLVLTGTGLLRRAGAASLADPRSVALVLAVIAVLTFLSTPGQNLISRRIETRADVHALELTRDPNTFISMQRSLALRSLADQDPPAWQFIWYASHPTAAQRIALAREWSAINGVPQPPDLARMAGSTK